MRSRREPPVRDADAWQRLSGELDALAQHSPLPHLLDSAWFDAAWQWTGTGATLNVQPLRDDGRLIGVAPLVLSRARRAGITARRLGFLAVPDTQFCDLVVATADREIAAHALAAALHADRGEWDVLELAYLSDVAPAWRALVASLAGAGLTPIVEAAGTNPFIDLTGTWDDFYGARSRSLKKSVNLSANRLAKAGKIEVQWARGAQADDAVLAEAVRVSAISWKKDTGNSLDQPGPNAFIRHLTAAGRRNAAVSIWLLRLDGKVIATEYQWIAHGAVHALRSDFDPAYAEASPGTYLNHHLLQRLFGEGLRRYYMGPGSNAYKLRWTDQGEPMFRVTAFSPTLRGQALRFVERAVKPLGRRLRARFVRTTETQAGQ